MRLATPSTLCELSLTCYLWAAALANPVYAQTTFFVTSVADDSDFDTSDGVCDTDDGAGDGHQVIDNVVVSEGEDGIEFRGPDDAVVQGNRIVGSERDGLSMGCTGSTAQGNVIGRDASGTVIGSGRDGIYVTSIPSNIMIGGTASGAPNVIAGSGRNGITLEKADVTGDIQWPGPVTIRRNVITESEQVGIDLDNNSAEVNFEEIVDGETPNDAGDGDTDVPNNLQNFPTFSRLDYDAGANTGTVEYEVDTAPANATYPLTVDPYRTGPYGQAEAYLGSVTIAEAGPQTLQTETFTAEAPLDRQDFVVATVTTDNGRTSEISPLTQTVTVPGDVLQTYAFDYLVIRVDAAGPDNSSAPLTIRHELRDPEHGPPVGEALGIAGSWTPTTNGSASLNTLCLPLDDLISEPVEIRPSPCTAARRRAIRGSNGRPISRRLTGATMEMAPWATNVSLLPTHRNSPSNSRPSPPQRPAMS